MSLRRQPAAAISDIIRCAHFVPGTLVCLSVRILDMSVVVLTASIPDPGAAGSAAARTEALFKDACVCGGGG